MQVLLDCLALIGQEMSWAAGRITCPWHGDDCGGHDAAALFELASQSIAEDWLRSQWFREGVPRSEINERIAVLAWD